MRLRRTVAGLAAAGLAMLGAVACQPFFDQDTVTATALGQLTRLTWTAAQDDDPGESVVEYGIEVDGVEVSRFPAASGLSCVLTGLTGGTSYQLSITAYGNTGEWSGSYGGDLASMARVATTYTPPRTGAPAGSTRTCVHPADSDGDRLPNALEQGGGAFVSAASPGTSPTNADTDGDGLGDGDEVLGTESGIDLYAMGTRPTKKDLLFEFDWFDDALDCAAHSHRPTSAIVARVKTAFGATPTTNPDGTTGINVIGDYGQGGVLTGGNRIADADGVLSAGVNGGEFQALKAAHFAPARKNLFHYVVLAHRYNATSGSSGQAELYGDDMIVTLQCNAQSTNAVGNTIMHEVGHNLGLWHGGNEEVNYKPNYNSVMNYRYQFPGVDTNCTVAGDGLLAYSTGGRAALDEGSLRETDGICNGVDVDWNGNSVIDPGTVAVSVNNDTALQTLTDHNDAANLCLTCVVGGDGAPSPNSRTSEPIVITEQDTPPGLP